MKSSTVYRGILQSKKIGVFSKDASRSTKLKEEWYATSQHYPLKFSISIGFMWNYGDEQIYLGTKIWLPKASKYKSTPTYFKLFKRYLKGWELDDWENEYIFGKYETVGQFILDEEEQIPAMINFLKNRIDQLEVLKKIDPKIFD